MSKVDCAFNLSNISWTSIHRSYHPAVWCTRGARQLHFIYTASRPRVCTHSTVFVSNEISFILPGYLCHSSSFHLATILSLVFYWYEDNQSTQTVLLNFCTIINLSVRQKQSHHQDTSGCSCVKAEECWHGNDPVVFWVIFKGLVGCKVGEGLHWNQQWCGCRKLIKGFPLVTALNMIPGERLGRLVSKAMGRDSIKQAINLG